MVFDSNITLPSFTDRQYKIEMVGNAHPVTNMEQQRQIKRIESASKLLPYCYMVA